MLINLTLKRRGIAGPWTIVGVHDPAIIYPIPFNTEEFTVLNSSISKYLYKITYGSTFVPHFGIQNG